MDLNLFLKLKKEIAQLKKFKKSISIINGESFIFFNFNLYGGTTGRITTQNYPVQSIPRSWRQIIRPRKGHIFVVADVSQEEVRIITEVSRDAALLKIFSEKLDYHAYTASILSGFSYSEFMNLKETSPDEFKTKRFLAKVLNFGLFYGMGAPTLKKILEKGGVFISLRETKINWNKWHNNYRGIRKFQEEMVNCLWKSKFKKTKPIFFSYGENRRNHFFITSVGGRVKRDSVLDIGCVNYEKFSYHRKFHGEYSNFPIQATGVDILSLFLKEIEKKNKTFWVCCNGGAPCRRRRFIETEPQNYDEVISIIRKIEKQVGG